MSSPLSVLSPADSIDGRFLPFSPAETTYSSDDNDTIPETPHTEHAERDIFNRHHYNYDHSLYFSSADDVNQFTTKNMNDLCFATSTIPQIYTPSSSSDQCSFSSSTSFASPSELTLAADPSDSSLGKPEVEADPFDAAFAVVNEERVTHAPLLVQTSFVEAARYSARFPAGHLLHSTFVHNYDLGEELGSGGYGFVMTAYNREHGYEVAVKFIIKSKISEHAWMEDATYGRLPTEVMLLSLVDHSSIVKCLDLYEDQFCFYLVQELHGSPWSKKEPVKTESQLPTRRDSRFSRVDSPSANASLELSSDTPESSSQHLSAHSSNGNPLYHTSDSQSAQHDRNQPAPNQLLHPPQFPRRPSHDLFECIEQTPGKRLSEEQACYVFAQIVNAVHYLDRQGITHRDIKDENLLIDKDLKVKLIDFGSAVIADPDEPRPYYTLFFGTIAYASSEILLKRHYQAPPAEVWTLGVLLSYILTGMSPFPTQQDAIDGRIILAEIPGMQLSQACLDLMRRCLEPNPELRANIGEVRRHPWMQPSSV